MRLCDVYRTSSSPVNYFNIPSHSYQLLVTFSENIIGSSDLFTYYWRERLYSIVESQMFHNAGKRKFDQPDGIFKDAFEMLADEEKIRLKLPLSLSQIVLYLLIPSLEETYQEVMNLISGNVSINNAVKYMELCKDFTKELTQLGSCFDIKISNNDIDSCSQRLECASNMKTCVDQSNAILQTAEVLELDGDFSSIEKIKNKVTNIFPPFVNMLIICQYFVNRHQISLAKHKIYCCGKLLNK